MTMDFFEGDILPKLPNEISLNILSLLPTTAHASIRGVCRQWKLLVESGKLYAWRANTRLLDPCLFFLLKDTNSSSLLLRAFVPEKNTWLTNLRPLPYADVLSADADKSEALDALALVNVGRRLFLIGGRDRRFSDGSEQAHARTFCYDIATDEWLTCSDMHEARSEFASAQFSRAILVAGGFRGDSRAAGVSASDEQHVHDGYPSTEREITSVELYDTDVDAWTILPPLPSNPHRHPPLFGIKHGDRLAVLSGGSSVAETFDFGRDKIWGEVLLPGVIPDGTRSVVVTPVGCGAAHVVGGQSEGLHDLVVLRHLWPPGEWEVRRLRRGIEMRQHQNIKIACSLGETCSIGAVKHPRELVICGGKLYLVGNKHRRPIRSRHGVQGPSALQISEWGGGHACDGDGRGHGSSWKSMEVGFECNRGSWLLACIAGHI